MFNTLSAMTLGIVVFAVLAVVGSVILSNLGSAVGAGPANDTAFYLQTQLGSTSGGLASYAPALIAVGVGAIFIGLLAGFMVNKGKSY
jgi:hypothetical protein